MSLNAQMAKERSQGVVRQESERLFGKVMTEIEKAADKGTFRISVEVAAVPANVCLQTIKTLKDRGFCTDISEAVLKVSWGGMDNE